jgi:predicted ATP-dependent endonuclease of OLD family
MFIQRVFIKNYRCLERADVTFNSKMNVIVGNNECGKSTDGAGLCLCLSDNRGRSEVTPLRRGRETKWAIEHLHGRSRQS